MATGEGLGARIGVGVGLGFKFEVAVTAGVVSESVVASSIFCLEPGVGTVFEPQATASRTHEMIRTKSLTRQALCNM